MVWVQRDKWDILLWINSQAKTKLVVSVFANEPGILHMVLILVFLNFLKNWKSVYEMCFGMFKAFPFTGCCALVHFSSVRFTVELHDLKGLFQPTWFCDYDFEESAGFSRLRSSEAGLYLALCRVVCNMELIRPAGKPRVVFALPSVYLFISLVFRCRTVDENKLGNKNSI